MKKMKLALLLVCALLAMCVASSCTSAAEITVNLVVTAGEDVIYNGEVKLGGENPTVLNAMLEMKATNAQGIDVTLNNAGNSVKCIKTAANTYDDVEIDGIAYYWTFNVNNQEREEKSGKADAYTVHDGDTINYIYTTYDMTAKG